ncbi:MAG: DNA alkylation repair protein [Clostridia bacterium]|nr:DNA alkylation repair protein [Clostridia bacterium]
MTDVLAVIYQHQDAAYGDFLAKLIPTTPREKVIGVRAPEYKKIIREIGSEAAEEFLTRLPHAYHEENSLHAALLNQMKDYDACVEKVEAFLPYIDNWAVNDSLNPACFKKHRDELAEHVPRWMQSAETYTRRFGLRMVMCHYLQEDFRPGFLDLAASLRSEEYYVNMMTAWLFAEALVKQWDAALPYLTDQRLDRWTHNKAIQKACESFRITDEQKQLLRTMKIK